jgi:hypothetical protein
METWAVVRQAFGREGVRGTLLISCRSTSSERSKQARQVKTKVKRMLIIFFDIKGIVHKECFLAGHTVMSAYYCDVLRKLHRNVRRLRLELWGQKTGCSITTAHCLTFSSSWGKFLTESKRLWSQTHASRLIWAPEIFFLFPKMFIQLKWSRQDRRRCWTATEYHFQDAF